MAKSDISRRQFVGLSAAAVSAFSAARAFGQIPNRASSALAASKIPIAPLQAPDWKDQGIENLSRSPYAKLHQVPVRAVTIKSGFWAQRRETNVSRSIPTMHDLLEAHGRMNNFRRLVGKSSAPQIGPVFSDSDVYKWTEAVGWALQSGDLPKLRMLSEQVINEVVAVQEPSGYLNTYFVGDRASQRMLPETQATGHELYCLGHMLQGAIAYYRATGERTLLDAGIRFVDGFLLPNYGPAPKKPIVSGHPEIEMSLIELYRITGDKRQLDLAGYILGGDDRLKFPERRTIYMFSGTPFTARTHLQGHAVRAMYACCGATDYFIETGDPVYWKTLNTLWNDLVTTKMYISGGVGARSDGEAFGDAYELPNARAYGESCAAIGNMMWNWRMLSATGQAKFADVMERALYNGINSGMSLDGTLYCYRNPLAFDPSTGDKIRNPWYDVTCCPPNLERTFASLPGYLYSTSSDGVYLHFFENSELNWHLEDGTALTVAQKTNYPWEGDVEIAISPAKPSQFTFYLRVPGWADSAQVAINRQPLSGATPGEYLPIRRRWVAGDVIRVQLPMHPHVLQANVRIPEDTGRVAVQRGPLLYCMEELDQPSGVGLADAALQFGQDPQAGFQGDYRQHLLDGVLMLHHEGIAYQESAARLYSRYTGHPPKARRVPLSFIPYYAWANRQPTAMQVWTRLYKA